MNVTDSTASKNALLNQTLGKYKIQQELGRGSMGVVYLAHDPFINRQVAIKVAHADRLASKDEGELYKKLFFNEAKAAGMLKHPNITGVYDAGVSEGNYYIVMEYVHGGHTLDEHCTPQTLLPINEVITLIYKCACAIDFAHKRGVVHRDIKPHNLLLTPDRDVKISDFGIAVVTDITSTTLRQFAGSPLYMSPEQIMDKEVGPQSDLFSLALVMYQLLTAQHPFHGNNFDAIQHRILNSPLPPLRSYRAEIPEVLERVMSKALARDLNQRYKTAMDLAGDLSLVFDFVKPAQEAVSRQEKFNAVRAQDFFREFTDAEIWELLNASQWLILKAGETVFDEGDVDKSFFIIISGAVEVIKSTVVVDHLSNGDCFGEMGVISGRKRSATIRTNENSTIMKVQSAMIERTSVNCQMRFHKLFLHTLIERLSRATERIARTEERLSSTLM